jgi:acyl-CoA thioesterase FadM
MEVNMESGFYLTLKSSTKLDWIDSNEHVNMSIYVRLLDKSLDLLVNLPGSINCILPKGVGFVASRLNTAFVSELIHPTSFVMNAGITSLDEFGFSSYHCIFVNDKKIARLYLKSSFFDLKTRKSIQISKDNLEKFDLSILPGIKSNYRF